MLIANLIFNIKITTTKLKKKITLLTITANTKVSKILSLIDTKRKDYGLGGFVCFTY